MQYFFFWIANLTIFLIVNTHYSSVKVFENVWILGKFNVVHWVISPACFLLCLMDLYLRERPLSARFLIRKAGDMLDAFFSPIWPPVVITFWYDVFLWCFPHVPCLGTHCHYPSPGHLRTFSNLPAILPASALFPYSLFSMLHPDGLSRRLIRPCHALHKASNSSLCLWRKAVLICLVLRPFRISPQPPFPVSLVTTPLSHIVCRHTEPLPTLLPPTSLPQHGGPLPVFTNPSFPQWPGTYWVCICWVNKWMNDLSVAPWAGHPAHPIS